MPISGATVYRHIKKRYYSIDLLDLPRAVKFKPRNTNTHEFIPSWAKKGRTYEDYLQFVELNASMPIVELDTVIGRIGGKTSMTIHIVSCNFMFGLLLENKTTAQAAEKIQLLKSALI